MIKFNRQRMMMAVFAGAALSTFATDYYWRTDAGSGNWNDTSKWNSSTGVPGAGDLASFTEEQTAPFTVSLTNDVTAGLVLGTVNPLKPVVATFDLNGYTLSHSHPTVSIDAKRALDWTVLDGTLLSEGAVKALNIGYYQGDWVSKVTLGAGAVYLNSGNIYVTVGSRSAGELVLRDGARLVTRQPGSEALRVGSSTEVGYTNYTARMTVTGAGSVWSNQAGTIYLSTHPLAKAELNITDGGAVVHNGSSFVVVNSTNATAELNITTNGSLTHNGGYFYVGGGAGANASLNITSGGLLDARGATNYFAIGNNGTGTVTVTGTDSRLLVGTNVIMANIAGTSDGTLIIEKGGLFERTNAFNFTMYLGNKDNAAGRVIVRDGGQYRWVGGQGAIRMGGQGSAEGSTGELIVTGATSRAIIGEVAAAPIRGNGLVTVAGGGTLEIFRNIYFGRIYTNTVSSHNGVAKLLVTGAGSVLKKSALTAGDLPGAAISVNTSLGVGGCGYQGWTAAGLLYATGYGPGGKAEAVIENGGLVSLNALIGVYSNSTLRIDGGRTESATVGFETNAVFNAVLRAGDANGSALMTASSEVRLWGATLDLDLGADFTRRGGDVYTLISGPLHATLNRFTYNGSRLQDGDVIEAGGTAFKVAYTADAVTLTVRQTGTLIRVL